MLKHFVKKAAYAIAPHWVPIAKRQWWNAKQLRQAHLLRRSCAKCKHLEEIVDVVLNNEWFSAEQKRTEILSLLKILQQEPPRRVCEIGSRRGGSLILLAQVACPNAQILSVDINYSPAQIKLNQRFTLAKQQITCLQADSHSPSTLRFVQDWLKGKQLDFLFIDGDHSFVGVQSDFTMYGPLVRSGGYIGFHDIVPDFTTRFGIRTPSDVGQVPAFWTNLKSQGYITEELIDNINQDGAGIGLVKWFGEHASDYAFSRTLVE